MDFESLLNELIEYASCANMKREYCYLLRTKFVYLFKKQNHLYDELKEIEAKLGKLEKEIFDGT